MRYLKITLSGAALFLVYLWVTVMFNSCNNNAKVDPNTTDETTLLEEEMDDSDYSSEFEGDEEGDYSTDSDSDSMEEDDDYEAGDYTTSEENTKRFPSTENSKSSGNTSLEPRKKREERKEEQQRDTYVSSSSSGDYMVIAGSYLLEDNAKRMIQKLKGMGYSNAEIIYFDNSQYHSICAGKYDSNSSASQTAGNLKSSGIDSYVHRRQ